MFADRDFDFGTAVRGELIEHAFAVRNAGSSPLRIRSVTMSAPLLVTRMPGELAPGERGMIRARLDTRQLQGHYAGELNVHVDEDDRPEAILSFGGRIVAPIEVAPMPAFFVIGNRSRDSEESVEIINHEALPVHIESVEHPGDAFVTRLTMLQPGRRYRLTLTLRRDGPAGRQTTAIRLRTTSPTTPLLTITANTYLRERVNVFPERVDVGAWRLSDLRATPGLSEPAAQTLMVYQMGGSDFDVDVSSDVSALHLRVERGPTGDRFQITAALIESKLAPGPIDGVIRIRTNDPEFPALLVPVSGVIID